MHVALVHMRHASIGGTELILEKLSGELAARGHEVTIVCRSHVEPAHPTIRFVVLRSPVIGSAWRMWAFAKAVERHVRESSYDLVCGLGKTWTHDVVRTGGGSHATYMERMRAVDSGSMRRSFKDSLSLRIERRAFAPGAYRRVIANSNLVREDMCRRYAIPPERVEVIYNGVDLERFHPRLKAEAAALRKELGAEPADFVSLFLGKGFARKGLARLLDAFALLAAQHPRAQLWIAGRDSSQARYEARSKALGLESRVIFLGERRDPERLLAACDVHVLPTHYDSFAFTVLESLACGTPVITTDAAGASELVTGTIASEILPGECSAEQLSAALARWHDRERVAAAATPARAIAELHGFDTTMARMAAVLERVESEKRTGHPV